MTPAERESAYYSAMAYVHTLQAEAEGARERAERLDPFTTTEARRKWHIGFRRHQAAYHRAMADYYAACARDEDPEFPSSEDYPDFEDTPEGKAA